MPAHVTGGIRRVLTCTANFDETVAFFREVLRLTVSGQGVPVTDTQFSRYTSFEMPGGVVLEIVEPAEAVRDLYRGPVVSITVADVGDARREMEARGVAFTTPVFDTGDGWGWTYFRAPDGNLYQIDGPYRP